MQEYARVCKGMQEYAQVCKSMQEYARASKTSKARVLSMQDYTGQV